MEWRGRAPRRHRPLVSSTRWPCSTRSPAANENGGGDNRDLFHYPTDADGNRCDTRAEVLLRDTMVLVLPTPGICVFGGGRWYSAYDGVTTTNPADLEIDHVVALKEAWDSGAFAWVTLAWPSTATI